MRQKHAVPQNILPRPIADKMLEHSEGQGLLATTTYSHSEGDKCIEH